MLRSVPAKVAAHSEQPFGKSKEMSGIVISLDGPADSQQALEWAVTHATREHTPLIVLAVHQVAASPWTGNPIIYPADRPAADKTVTAVKEAVSKTMSKLGDDRPSSVTVRGFIGQPADALIEASHEADMVVVEQRSGLARFLTRSVSAQVTHHAACPVVVISGQK
jgi:nucleotide-binding universal stress UspA family protein